jgi:predicted DNA-binding transcriptional regulator AlpA
MTRRATIALAPPEAAPDDPLAGRLALRIDDIVKATGLSRSAIEKARRLGAFPEPSRVVGRCPIWSPSTIRRWVEGGGR